MECGSSLYSFPPPTYLLSSNYFAQLMVNNMARWEKVPVNYNHCLYLSCDSDIYVFKSPSLFIYHLEVTVAIPLMA